VLITSDIRFDQRGLGSASSDRAGYWNYCALIRICFGSIEEIFGSSRATASPAVRHPWKILMTMVASIFPLVASMSLQFVSSVERMTDHCQPDLGLKEELFYAAPVSY